MHNPKSFRRASGSALLVSCHAFRSLSLAAALIVLLAAAAAAAPPAVRIATEEAAAGGRDILYDLVVTAAPASSAPVLTDVRTGKEVLCQAYRKGGRTHLVWVVPRLERGQRGSWNLSWKERASVGSTRAVRLTREHGAYVRVDIGGDLFTRYVWSKEEFKPYLYPIMLDGVGLTRNYPMKTGVEGETADHPHHRSFYFTHGDVNGISFWHEGRDAGRIVHRSFGTVAGGPVAGILETDADWITPDGKKLLTDHRLYRFFSPEDGVRIIDLEVRLTAVADKVTLGDTKEGTFGIRVAGWMKERSGGHVLTSRGVKGARKAWGRPAEWVDYTAPHGGKTFGIAILDHPTSLRHPTHWHVRDYGLFAANPFGYHNFYRRKTKDGNLDLARGATVTFKYRVVFHRGTTADAGIGEIYNGFAKAPAAAAAAR